MPSFVPEQRKQTDLTYLTREGEPGGRVWKLSEQLGHSLRFLDTGNCFKSKKIGSCCCQTLHLRPVPIFQLLSGGETRSTEMVKYKEMQSHMEDQKENMKGITTP